MNAPISTRQPLTLDQALAIINQLQQYVSELQACIAEQQRRITTLEERLKLDSRTSSKPPSSDGPATPPHKRKPSGKKRGGQPGHKGTHRAMLPPEQVDHIIDCPPPEHCQCGAAIQSDDRPPLRHQVFDLPPIRPVVTEYRQLAGICPNCGRRHRGQLPAGVPAGQLGPNALALLGALAGQCHLTQGKIQVLFREAFGLDFSIGAISDAHGIVANALAAPVAQMADAICREPVRHADETSHQSHGMHFWLWAKVTGWGAHFQIKSSRGKLAAQALLGEHPDGVIVTDRYASYHWVGTQHRQVCWAHLQRDFARMAMRPGQAGKIGQRLWLLSCLLFRWSHETPPPNGWDRLQRRVRQALQDGGANSQNCQRTAKTCRNLLAIWESLWHFVTDPAVPPTNNLAERALRGVVLRRKISYVTRSGRGMRFVERVFAVAYACRQQGRSLFGYFRSAIDADLNQVAAPSLVPMRQATTG